MNQGQQKQNSKKPNPFIVGDNVLETIRGVGASVGKTALDETTQKLPDNFIRDMFGAGAVSEELRPNEPIDIQQEKPQKVTPKDLIHALTTKDKSLTEHEIEQLRTQLKAFAPKTNNQEVKKAAIEQPAQETGTYHENRLERLLNVAKKFMTNPDDGLTWFKEAGKRKKLKGFWGSYKKHGTTFGLSSERTASTQSG